MLPNAPGYRAAAPLNVPKHAHSGDIDGTEQHPQDDHGTKITRYFMLIG
jgi:hypothetical protein